MDATEGPNKRKTKQLAYSRRQKENDTFAEIAKTLPVSADGVKELDKASILRVAIHFIKLRQFMDQHENADENAIMFDDNNNNSTSLVKPEASLPDFSEEMIKALDGFLLIVSGEGFILYSSDSISDYLGLRQVDVIGHHIQDLVHPQDYHELVSTFPPKGLHYPLPGHQHHRNNRQTNYLLRMRCSFTPTVRTLTRCSNFKPIYLNAHFKYSNTGSSYGSGNSFSGMIATCKLAGTSCIREICVGTSFRTKHSLDLKYTFLDTRIRWLVGYDPAELLGKKGYDYFHPLDLVATSHCHAKLLNNGRSASPSYRFLTKWGDWVWVRTCSEVTFDAVTHLPVSLTLWTWIVSAQESVECNQAYESHYKTPFKVHHAEYPCLEDSSNPVQSSSQSNSPVMAQVKTEQLENCSSPSTVMSSSAATTRQSSPLSMIGAQDGSIHPEATSSVRNKPELPINLSTPPCTPMTASSVVTTPSKLATTPIGAHHDYSLQQTMISTSRGSRMSPLSLGDVNNVAPTLDDLLLPVVADGYKYPTPSPTDSGGRGGSYSPTEDAAHMTHGSLHCTNISADLLMSPDSQPTLSPDIIGYNSHHGNSGYDNGNLDNLLATSCGNTTNLTSSFDLNNVSVSDILSEVQASLDNDIVATSADISTSQCSPLTSTGNTRASPQNVDTTLLSFGDLTNSSNLLGFTMMSSSLGATGRVPRDPSGVRQRYGGVAPSSMAGTKRRSAEKEAAIRSIVDSFHQVEQMVPANEMMPNYTM